MNNPVYFISGLGADERAFLALNLDFEPLFIRYISPRKGESLSSYCLRMSEQINPEHEPILVGLSLGGLMANRISRIRKVKKIIFLSSIKQRSERPKRFSVFRRLPLYKIAPDRVLREVLVRNAAVTNKLGRWETEAFDLMVKESPPNFLKWGIEQALDWDADLPKVPYVHLHGDEDVMFPKRRISDADLIHEGRHFMVFTRSQEVSQFINKEVANCV